MAPVRPLEDVFGSLLGGSRKKKAAPTDTVGVAGTAIYGGYVVENEESSALTDRERLRTFGELLANTSIIAAGVRYFLNLSAKASWNFVPSEADKDGKFAELAEKTLTEDPKTSWARIVRRAAMYRFYGFSIQEWTARRREDGVITMADISPRAQATIERWDVNTDGSVNGMVQRNPQNQSEIYLPRPKVLYLVDDTLNDSPVGLGLFRHLVAPAKRLARYEQLEAFGFESDLRGIPIGRAPYTQMRADVESGKIPATDALALVAPLESFIKKHIKNPELGLMLDSEVFATLDEAGRPSSTYKFDMSLLEGSQTSLPEIAKAIERVNREIARVLGTEAILLGDGQAGSHALSQDKTNQFTLIVEATLEELGEGFRADLMTPLWQLNGWPEEMMPDMQPEAVQYRDVEEITGALKDLAAAGAPTMPDDPAINDVRALIGVALADLTNLDEDEALNTGTNTGKKPKDKKEEGSVDDPEEDLPGDETKDE